MRERRAFNEPLGEGARLQAHLMIWRDLCAKASCISAVCIDFLAVNGPLTNGKRGEALYRLAQNATDGPITPELETARSDRVLNYSVFMTACELIAALYIMSNKPGLASSVLAAAIAAVVALVPMALVTRKKAAPIPNLSA